MLMPAVLVASMTGCSSQISDLRPYLSEKELQLEQNTSIAAIQSHYFTTEAMAAVESIPALDGPGMSGYAAGVNVWANIASFVTLNGVGRKIILPPSTLAQWGAASVIHEYIHHLDDMDRDGESEWIDHEKFREAYLLMSKDMRHAGIVIWAESMVGSMMTPGLFGVGDLSEQIAYVGQIIATRGGPDYMNYVFRRILRVTYGERSNVTLTDGSVVEVEIE
jgi:hypothetical protein